MTKQDYEAIAKVIHGNIEQVLLFPPSDVPYQGEGVGLHESCAIQLDTLVHELALVFERDNPRFNWDKWEAACGLTEVL